jgi:hypothetical protein
MAEPVIPDTPAAVPVVAAEPVVVATPAAPTAPAVETPVVSAPVEPAAPAVEAPKAEPHPSEVPSLLEQVAKKPDEKPAEVAKPAEAPKVDAKPEDKPAEVAKPEVVAPVEPEKIEWKFELPETLKADEPTLAKFTGALDGLMKPESRAEAAQSLLNQHNDAMVAYDKQLRENQVKAFNDTRAEWRKQVMADAQIGGAGHQTAMGAIARMRDMAISDAKPGTPQYEADAKEFNDFLRITGAGDHPAYLKQLHRFARFFDEPSVPAPGAQPTKTNGVAPGSKSLYAPRPNQSR